MMFRVRVDRGFHDEQAEEDERRQMLLPLALPADEELDDSDGDRTEDEDRG